LGNLNKGNHSKFCNPYDSLGYCKRLFFGYQDWNLDKLPNPELRRKELMDVTHGVNRIYSMGLYFVIIHEFSHIIRGDIFQFNVSKTKFHEMEFACDTYAFEVFASSTDLENPEVFIGLLCAIGLITFASSFNEKFTLKHPFPDERLMNIINGFVKHSNIESNNPVWIIATWILVTWDFLRNRIFPGIEGSVLSVEQIKDGNVRLVFEKTLARLQDKKIWL
jgi:hypothetical protein